MGALTGNAVKDTYLDLVQLGQSGAGLPAHAGKEAALYDGSGAQILGRTAVRHWLDPHPDAASFDETWEFSTYGDATHGQLEAAGWTFSNCTASVTRGQLLCVATGDNPYAQLIVSLTGDFHYEACAAILSYNDQVYSPQAYTGIYVAATGTPFMFGAAVGVYQSDHRIYVDRAADATPPLTTSTTQVLNQALYHDGLRFAVWRTSGDLQASRFPESTSGPYKTTNWGVPSTAYNETSTYDRLFVGPSKCQGASGDKFGLRYLRRLA